MRFRELVETFERIEATTKRLEMTSLLVGLLKRTPVDIIDKVVYLTQGKLYPDYVGVELGVAEKLVIRAIALASGRDDGDVLRDYKASGDLGLTAERFLGKKAQAGLAGEPLTVPTVYKTFEEVARATGPGSVDSKISMLGSLLSGASPKEAKYIVRMALGKLRLGVADMTILDALAVAFVGEKGARKTIERAYSLSSDLGHVAKAVAAKGIDGVERFRVTIGKPIRPMLAERLSEPGEILDKLGGVGSAEFKYDGLRVQAHISPKAVYLFSRRLENITSQFPDVVQSLRGAVNAESVILEAECVAVDPNTGDMLPFQVISQRRGRKYEILEMAEEVPVTIFLFDALYLNGEDLTTKPYTERRDVLRRIVQETDRVKIARQVVVKSPEDLEDYLNEAVSAGCEGLVVKSIGADSVYQAGARGWLWIKYKRSYKAAMMDTFDLVPVGAFYGRGKRAGSYGALLMAVYNPDADAFETICKLGSGFTDEDLDNLPKLMRTYISPHRHPRVVSLMEPDLWFAPGCVMEVAADEITLSPLHTCARDAIRKGSGLALRFPRFTGNWRKDKSPEDATTTGEAEAMYKRQLKKVEPEL